MADFRNIMAIHAHKKDILDLSFQDGFDYGVDFFDAALSSKDDYFYLIYDNEIGPTLVGAIIFSINDRNETNVRFLSINKKYSINEICSRLLWLAEKQDVKTVFVSIGESDLEKQIALRNNGYKCVSYKKDGADYIFTKTL